MTAMQPCAPVRRILDELVVFCSLRDKGCSWQGEWQALEHHMSECAWVRVPCPFVGCSESVERRSLAAHRESCVHRVVPCPKCGEGVPALMLRDHAEKDCPRELISCLQCGLARVERSLMPEHLHTQCTVAWANCCFHDVGCTFRERREQVRTHEATCIFRQLESPLSAMRTRITSLETRLNEAVTQIEALRGELSRRQSGCADSGRRGIAVREADIRIGLRVIRGRDWKWGEQDGGAGHEGVVVGRVADAASWWRVTWDASQQSNNYRVGEAGSYDLAFA